MKIRIIALGRAKAGPEKSLVETYAKRLSWSCDLIELEAKKGLSGAELIAAEAELIEKAAGDQGQRQARGHRARMSVARACRQPRLRQAHHGAGQPGL